MMITIGSVISVIFLTIFVVFHRNVLYITYFWVIRKIRSTKVVVVPAGSTVRYRLYARDRCIGEVPPKQSEGSYDFAGDADVPLFGIPAVHKPPISRVRASW